jgi:hypothetical protein
MALCPLGSSSSFTPATVTTEHSSDAPHKVSTTLACQAGPCLSNSIAPNDTVHHYDTVHHSGQSAAMFAVSLLLIATTSKTADT